MKDINIFLKEFAKIADEWFSKTPFVEENYNFFKEFFKKENLEKAEWEDFQKISSHIHSLKEMEIAGGRAFGRLNHPIEQYRKSFIYLVYGNDPIEVRIKNFVKNKEYKIKFLGENSNSELLGYLFADDFVFYTKRDRFALNFLEIDPGYKRGDDFTEKLLKFNKAVIPVREQYEKIVGNRTGLPTNLEIDQLFSYLYENYKDQKLEKPIPVPVQSDINYWWLNSNPKIWNIMDMKMHEKQSYTSVNEKGNKRRVFKYFEEAKVGDIVVGYVSTPIKEIVCICKITNNIHQSETENGYIEFEKIEDFKYHISFSELQVISELKNAEPIINNQGSLFKLTQDEYEVIRSIIDEKNPPVEVEPLVKYTLQNASEEIFLDRKEIKEILDLLEYKKNIILQGPPGVGKTFIAKKLAYASLGKKDEEKIKMIQFHQSYSYEDFIQGYRPSGDGRFILKNGIFYEFCRRAQYDPQNNYFFIIDEINRGNLSKIFGELMMLIEADKRGQDFAISLTYSETDEDKFSIPLNMHLIGTMNTADRSLAMVDYALRRRFSFIDLNPQFKNKKFYDLLLSKNISVNLIKKIVDNMESLNQEIANDKKNLGRGFMIGHSYFCPIDDSIIDESEWYRKIIKTEIAPLINEYWFENELQADEKISTLLE